MPNYREDLVWSGHSVMGAQNTHNFYVCPYNGSSHLCLFQGDQQPGYSRGQGLILDDSYRIVKSVHSGNGLPGNDLHEFNILNGGKSVLVTVYIPLPYDLTDYNITSGIGWLQNSAFQEVEVETGRVLFEWKSVDHVEPSASYVLPNTTDVSGDGLTKDTAWDYLYVHLLRIIRNILSALDTSIMKCIIYFPRYMCALIIQSDLKSSVI